MNYNIKHIAHAAAVLCASMWLSGCATYAHLGTTLYWSGKDINEFIADKGVEPDTKKICKDKNKPFLIYGFARPIYHTYDREVGEVIMLMVQPFIRKQNINLQVNIDGIIYLPILKVKLLLTVLIQALVTLIKNLIVKIWMRLPMIRLN